MRFSKENRPIGFEVNNQSIEFIEFELCEKEDVDLMLGNFKSNNRLQFDAAPPRD
jgi:hypothetical protein